MNEERKWCSDALPRPRNEVEKIRCSVLMPYYRARFGDYA